MKKFQSLRPVLFKMNLPVKETISKKEQQLMPNETELHRCISVSARVISASVLRAFYAWLSPEAWVLGFKGKVEPVQPRVDPIRPVMVGRDPQAVLQGGRDWGPPTALEHRLQLSLSLALPELWCSPVLPGPAEPGPTTGLTSWPGLAQPHPRGPAGPSRGCV